jgi:hypothetical protein
VQELEAGPLHRFQDWPNDQVPKRAAGVYTVWEGDRLVYVGTSGRAMTADDLEASSGGRAVPKGLRTRLNAHASGRRSGISSACISATAAWSQRSPHPSSSSSPPAACRLTASPEHSFTTGLATGISSPPMESRRPGWRQRSDEGRSQSDTVSESIGATLELTAARLAHDFAAGLMLADARRPRWAAYQPGIGPHTEPRRSPWSSVS